MRSGAGIDMSRYSSAPCARLSTTGQRPARSAFEPEEIVDGHRAVKDFERGFPQKTVVAPMPLVDLHRGSRDGQVAPDDGRNAGLDARLPVEVIGSEMAIEEWSFWSSTA